ncbi:prevent-host-death family protein [Bifidobacterium eulemuris]|nr:prevent-host-death family protein [Bifidobacterium eulemuris]
MKTYTMAELSRSTKKICNENEPVIITNNGKPQCLMFNIEDAPIDEVVDYFTDALGTWALRRAQERAVSLGANAMTLDEINEEIRLARLEIGQGDYDA